MTTDDKIRCEKLQCNINREAARVPALSSGKTDKHEYLTGGEILPLEKQIKTIEHQGWKQLKALEEHGKQFVKSSDEKKSSTHLKQKETFEELANKRMSEIQILSKKLILII